MEQKLSLFNAAIALMKKKDITEDDIVVDDRYSLVLIKNFKDQVVFEFEVYDENIYEVFDMDDDEYHAFASDSFLLDDRVTNDEENNIDHNRPLKNLEDWVVETYKERLVFLVDKLPSNIYNKLEYVRSMMYADNKPLADFVFEKMYEFGDEWGMGELFSYIMDQCYDSIVNFSISYYESLIQNQVDTWISNMLHKGVLIQESTLSRFSFTISPQRMILLGHRCRDCDLVDIFSTSGVHSIHLPSENVLYMEAINMDDWGNSVDFDWVIKAIERKVDEFYDEIDDNEYVKETYKKLKPYNLRPLTLDPIPFKMGDGKEYLYHGFNFEGNYNIISDEKGKYKVPTDRLILLMTNTRLDLYN